MNECFKYFGFWGHLKYIFLMVFNFTCNICFMKAKPNKLLTSSYKLLVQAKEGTVFAHKGLVYQTTVQK